MWEVNYFGTMNVTRTFLPLIKEAPVGRRRIIFIGSVSSAGITKFFGTYPATKVALEATADEMRRELRPWGVQVSVLEPGIFHTKFTKNTAASKTALEELVSSGSAITKDYEEAYLKFWKTAMYPPHVPGNDVIRVATAIDYALHARFAPAKRAVGTDAHAFQLLGMILPDSVLDLLVNFAL